jgi:hypothetical protein
MNTLITLWLFVLASMIGIMTIFWAAENYAAYLGNFYVLTGIVLGLLVLSRLIVWVWNRLHRPNA